MNQTLTNYTLKLCVIVLISGLVGCYNQKRDEKLSSPDDFSRLVWSDEFDGPNLDLNKWNKEVRIRVDNEELQGYVDSVKNAYIDNGVLIIQAFKEKVTMYDPVEKKDITKDYTSTRINTRNKGDWKYGKIEVRAKLPKGKGIWPAIWMMPTDAVYGGWPKSGEIDIMEMKGSDPYNIAGTIHYGQLDGVSINKGKSYEIMRGDYSTEYHVFSIVWDENLIRWYVDGELFFHAQPQTTDPEPYPFNERFYLILNCAVGGWYDGDPDATTVFPQKMYIDYVRVYQK